MLQSLDNEHRGLPKGSSSLQVGSQSLGKGVCLRVSQESVFQLALEVTERDCENHLEQSVVCEGRQDSVSSALPAPVALEEVEALLQCGLLLPRSSGHVAAT